MKLVLMRHAEAEPLRLADSERALTARGHRQAEETVRWLSMKISQPFMLASSPYRRARETAAELQLVMPLAALHIVERITPEDLLRNALSELEAVANGEVVVVVTHMPLVAGLAGWLEHGVMTGSPFSLAEARLYDLDLLGPSQARLLDRFVPVA